ncbi:uncharacterized protein LOC142235949 [Haematobia irritans]|uniref:uncharacterized protein LOC142235949 n=1 Tax=Haematobia irritans TaxID=7368 RepID=UPI003F50062C
MSVASYIGRGKFNLDLIKEVQKYDALYNSAHPDFRNYAVKTHIWQEISKALGETEQFCKRRWLDLRKQYSKEQQKTQSVRNTFWIYTDALSFLKPYEKPKIEFLPREISKREAYCRTCLSSFQANPFQAPKTFNIFEIKDFAEKLSQCSSRQVVEWDEYPQVVCELCYKKVIYFYQFREMCLSSLEKFNTIIHDPKEVTYDLENTIEKSFNTTDNDSDLSNILDDSIKTEVEHGKPHSSHEIDDKIMDEIIQVEIERSAGADDVKPVEEFEEEKEISADFEYDTMESEKDFSNFESINEESVEHDPDYVVEELETIDYENPLEENTEEWNPQSSSEKSSVIKHSRTFKLKCDICPKICFTKHCLEAHKRMKHEGLPGFACTYEFCDKAYNRITDLHRHMDKHEGVQNEFTCQVENCGKVFTAYYSLNYHRRKEHNLLKIPKNQREENRTENLATTSSETQIKNENALDEVIVNTSSENFEDSVELAKDPDDIPTSSGHQQKQFVCETCGTVCKSAHSLKLHNKIHIDEWPYVCDKPGCGIKFKEKNHIITHLLCHAGKSSSEHHQRSVVYCGTVLNDTRESRRQYICEICGRILNDQFSLRRHKYIHVDKSEWPFACDVAGCTKRFRVKNQLKIHKNRHAGIRNYVCPHCNARKTTITELKFHMITHTKERPFSCKFCPKKYKIAPTLALHVRRNHTECKYSKCRFCDYQTTNPQRLKYHETKHTGEKPYSCSECDERFPTPWSRRVHMQTHANTSNEANLNACDECGKTFKQLASLRNHKKLHTEGVTPHICQHCGQGFRWPGSYYAHLKRHSTKEVTVKKEDQNEINVNESLFIESSNNFSIIISAIMRDGWWIQQSLSEKYSAIQHSKRIKFKCDICPKTFFTKHGLEAHQRRHQGLSGFACPYELCDKAYNRITDLRRHMAKHEGVKNEFICEVQNCGKLFSEYYALNHHRRKDHNFVMIPKRQREENRTENLGTTSSETNIENENTMDESIENTLDECIENTMFKYLENSVEIAKDPDVTPKSSDHQQKQFVCETCGTVCKNAYSLKLHSQIHIDEWPYVCDKPGCGIKFKEKNHIITHLLCHAGKSSSEHHQRSVVYCGTVLNDTRESRRQYICEICGRILNDQFSLRRHKYIHVDKSEWPFACDVAGCTKRFRVKHQLKIHKNRHAGIRNYVCPHCNARKTTITELKFHMITHTNERPFSCKFCPKTYKIAPALALHVRRNHTECKYFKCRFCDYQTTNPQRLKYHETKHTGEKPYSCSECDKRFTTPWSRRVHMQTHANTSKEAKLHACDECGKTFKQLASLRNHKKLHTEGVTPHICQHCGQGFRWPGSYYAHLKRHSTKEVTVKKEDQNEVIVHE